MTGPARRSERRLDVSSLVLLLLGLGCGIWAYVLIAENDLDPLLLVPSVVCATVGASNLAQRVAPRD